MQDYHFSPAVCADIPEIAHLYHSLVGTEGCTWDDEYPSAETARFDIGNQSLYILKQNGVIVAAASMGAFNELGHLDWTIKNPCELARIGVLPNMQRRGIGTVILQHVIKIAKSQGFGGMRMLVSKTNPAALALYEKNGFVRRGETFMFEHNFYCYEISFE